MPDGFQVDLDRLAAVATNDLPTVRDDVLASATALRSVEMSDEVIGGYPYGSMGGGPGSVCADILDGLVETQGRIAENLNSAGAALARIHANYRTLDESMAR